MRPAFPREAVIRQSVLAFAVLACAPALADQIVISEEAGRVVSFAAQELQRHLKEITGVTYPIVTDAESANDFEYRVGPSRRTLFKKGDLESQVWTINVTDDAVELVGLDDSTKGGGLPGIYDEQGSLYAVYEFLEKDCGVIWADSTDYGTVFTKRGVIRPVKGCRRGKPFMRYRGGAPIDSGDRYFPEMWRKGSEGLKRYYAFAYSGKDEKAIHEQKRLFIRRHRLGGEYAPANHSFYWYYERFWYKEHKNFESYHPEYFAQGYTGEPPQLCYSNPETLKQVIADVRAYFDGGGFTNLYRNVGRTGYIWGKDSYALEPMDTGGYCKCQRCLAEYEPNREDDKAQQSTQWYRFVNEVARAIKKSHPTKRIATLAYSAHEGLPTDMKMEDNVVVYFCVSANRTPHMELLEQQLGRMRLWRQAYPKLQLALWLYNGFPLEVAQNGGFHCFPGFFATEAERQYRFFKELDVNGGIFHCGFNGEIANYMQSEWMIDPTRSAEAMLDECFAGCGKAEKPLKAFYRIVESRYRDKSLWPPKAGHETIEIAWNVLGNALTMTRLGELMAEAERLAETPFEKARVKCFRLAVWDYMKDGFDAYTVRAKAPVPKWIAPRVSAAGGDVAKVDWASLPTEKLVYLERGTDKPSGAFPDGTVRLANDGEWLYLELTEHAETAKLVNAPSIACFDTWELLFERQRAQPFRYYMSAPDGRISGQSWGEVNWRQNVKASETGHPSYGAKCVTDVTRPDVWTSRYAFPFATMLDKPVKPGETVYFNLVRVAGKAVAAKAEKAFGIFTFTPFTTVTTSDRAGEILIE